MYLGLWPLNRSDGRQHRFLSCVTDWSSVLALTIYVQGVHIYMAVSTSMIAAIAIIQQSFWPRWCIGIGAHRNIVVMTSPHGSVLRLHGTFSAGSHRGITLPPQLFKYTEFPCLGKATGFLDRHID